ncbi:MAG TPA: N-acetylmuramoyl-L-alanine amidase, partial [Dermatophilaceae bacterium]|nr:N-acetylmuramoyl-L-alanine amidase [Dermatophilaceae bacterium]
MVEHPALADLPEQRVAAQGRSTTRSGPADHVVTGTGNASLVGLTWLPRTAPADGTRVEVRGRDSTGRWTAWTATSVEADTDPVAEAAGRVTRVGTEPVWFGPVTSVQVRFADAAAAKVRTGRLELVEPRRAAADARSSAPAASARAATSRPAVLSRAAWGANESLRSCTPSYGSTTLASVVHHTAGSNNYTKAQSAAIVRGVYAYHTRSRGWCDIGYNALVDRYGQVFEGRYGGLDRPVTGAHTTGFNTDTFGVSVLGTFSTAAPPAAAVNALTNLLAWRASSFYRNPTGTTVLTSRSSNSRYRAGTKVTMPFILGHRNLGYTECPGNAFYPRLGALRTAVAARTAYTSSPLYRRWASLGGASGRLGPVWRGEAPMPFGARTVFQNARAGYAVGSSTRILGSGIDALYWRSGGPGRWGAPLTDEQLGTRGSWVSFSAGYSAAWSPATGSQPLHGSLGAYWLRTGAENSPVGFPREPERALANGWSQQFRVANVYVKRGGAS